MDANHSTIVLLRNKTIVEWFASDDGRDWAAERRRLPHNGEADAEIKATVSRDVSREPGPPLQALVLLAAVTAMRSAVEIPTAIAFAVVAAELFAV